MDLGLAIQKTIVGMKISILDIPCVPIFSQKEQLLNFLAHICPKKDLGLETEERNVGIRINIAETLCLPIFSQTGQL